MRVFLAGEGPPIPTIALPDPNISGGLTPQGLMLQNGVPFLKADYVELGYTHFEAWCVGAVGGRGGGMPQSFGGAGGGGGLHRVFGALAELPDSCPVVIGLAGSDGRTGEGYPLLPVLGPDGSAVQPFQWYPNPDYIAPLDAQDGGASTFNVDTCQASGGKGGKATTAIRYMDPGIPGHTTDYASPGGVGGEGGAGGRSVAGGGADGGFWTGGPYPAAFVHTNPDDGAWNGTIGEGGGGGHGGTSVSSGPGPSGLDQPAQSGGQGSFSYGDTSVYGVRQFSSYAGISQSQIVPGSGGGARLNSVSGFGSRAAGYSPDGAVFIRLTQLV